MLRTCFLATFLVATGAPSADEDRAKKDLALMQGDWSLQALEINGKIIAPEQLQDAVLRVKGDEYRSSNKNQILFTFRIKLDPKQDPRAMDMILAQPDGSERVHKAIYCFEQNTLKICRGANADQERPNQFATWPDTNVLLVTWKKQP